MGTPGHHGEEEEEDSSPSVRKAWCPFAWTVPCSQFGNIKPGERVRDKH